MKASASDAEALRDEQAAQVRAPHRLLVQPTNSATSNAVSKRFGSPLVAIYASAIGCVVPAVCADSTYVIFLIGPSSRLSRLTNRVGMVRREDEWPEAIGSRGGLGKAGFRACG